MKKFSKQFAVQPGTKVSLEKISPKFNMNATKDELKELTKKNLKRIEELQEALYAEHKQSLLIVFQAMDGGGKDGSIRVIGGAMNPQGCSVASFKAPTKIELEHDFLWRIAPHAPAKGMVSIFNRSHYEDVLVAKVRELASKPTIRQRYDDINAFEKRLADNGTRIVKFFLHISPEEQLERFKDRLEDPNKNWKISESDYSERAFWNDYQRAYETAMSKCSTKDAPWFIVPANSKKVRDAIISQIVVDTLESMKIADPKPTVDMAKIRQLYEKEKKAQDLKAKM